MKNFFKVLTLFSVLNSTFGDLKEFVKWQTLKFKNIPGKVKLMNNLLIMIYFQ